jgi:hypothetical protein
VNLVSALMDKSKTYQTYLNLCTELGINYLSQYLLSLIHEKSRSCHSLLLEIVVQVPMFPDNQNYCQLFLVKIIHCTYVQTYLRNIPSYHQQVAQVYNPPACHKILLIHESLNKNFLIEIRLIGTRSSLLLTISNATTYAYI